MPYAMIVIIIVRILHFNLDFLRITEEVFFGYQGFFFFFFFFFFCEDHVLI